MQLNVAARRLCPIQMTSDPVHTMLLYCEHSIYVVILHWIKDLLDANPLNFCIRRQWLATKLAAELHLQQNYGSFNTTACNCVASGIELASLVKNWSLS